MIKIKLFIKVKNTKILIQNIEEMHISQQIMVRIGIQQIIVKVEVIIKEEDNMVVQSLLRISTLLIQKIMIKEVTITTGQDKEIIMNNSIKKIT